MASVGMPKNDPRNGPEKSGSLTEQPDEIQVPPAINTSRAFYSCRSHSLEQRRGKREERVRPEYLGFKLAF